MDWRHAPPGYPDLAEVARRIGISGVLKCLIYNLRQKAQTARDSGKTWREVQAIWQLVDQLDMALIQVQETKRVQAAERALSKSARQKLGDSGADSVPCTFTATCQCAACASAALQQRLWFDSLEGSSPSEQV